MLSIQVVSLLSVLTSMATATPTPSPSALFTPNDNPTLAPTSSLTLWDKVKPVAPLPAPVKPPTISPTFTPKTLTPTIAPTISPTHTPTSLASDFPSFSPTVSTNEPSTAPVVTPTKQPTNGTFITSVQVTNLQLKLVNAGTLLEKHRWKVATEAFYNEYYEDIECKVTFVRSEKSEEPKINTITYDLLLQSEFFALNNPMQYALKPFRNEAANLQYGNDLRTLLNFERLTLPLAVPTRITDDSDQPKEKMLGLHALLGIVAAALFVAFLLLCWCKRTRRQENKASEAPMSTFRISSDDDISTIGPIDIVDSEKGGSINSGDDDFSKEMDGHNFGRAIISTISRRMCMGGSSNNGEEARDDEEAVDYTAGDWMEVVVPSGKLGIIINTPNDGPPVIHTVKETSAVMHQIQVGDKLIAIDDEDVQAMTAIQVSKIISSKSSESRKFTIVRPYDTVTV
ncbi:hypothetical protein FisN_38Lh011 [Fistulifera solaris]|uniref:PDZ domain-containing protein n=1 Tax=Fistulifera solaris TaxID=1519565 RepID=A0A1Z5J6I3_FISSO|nr:hypothetical protein FisN_38Lh011 [Fistulifera solaris]|eukprot:GAX09590.1 hypothetical protein FisN_38Lh011 [Fistulifera solaris]